MEDESKGDGAKSKRKPISDVGGVLCAIGIVIVGKIVVGLISGPRQPEASNPNFISNEEFERRYGQKAQNVQSALPLFVDIFANGETWISGEKIAASDLIARFETAKAEGKLFHVYVEPASGPNFSQSFVLEEIHRLKIRYSQSLSRLSLP